MKRLVTGFALLLMLATLVTANGLAAGKLSVAQETFYVLPFLTYNAGYVFAEVENTGDKPVVFNGGLFELFDKDGTSI